jgi:hypothetical protein
MRVLVAPQYRLTFGPEEAAQTIEPPLRDSEAGIVVNDKSAAYEKQPHSDPGQCGQPIGQSWGGFVDRIAGDEA